MKTYKEFIQETRKSDSQRKVAVRHFHEKSEAEKAKEAKDVERYKKGLEARRKRRKKTPISTKEPASGLPHHFSYGKPKL